LYPSKRAAWAAFLRHDDDVLHEVPPDVLATLARDPTIRVHRVKPIQFYTLLFQHRHPLLRDPRVRRALNIAIDREALVQRLFPDYAQQLDYVRLTTAPFSPEYWAVKGTGTPWPYDPAAARGLLAEAAQGRTDPIELRCLIVGQDELLSNMAALIETQLQRVHVRLRLEPVPLETFAARMTAGDFDLALTPMSMLSTSLWPYAMWASDQPDPMLRSGYSAADTALDALYHAPTPDAERAAAREVMDTMRRDPPAAFLMLAPITRAVHTNWIPNDAQRGFRLFMYRWTLKGFTPCGGS
jgi:ABC-type transport system substrate-binding protein